MMEDLFKKQVMLLDPEEWEKWRISDYAKKTLKDVDLEANKYFFLCMEEMMKDPEIEEYGDCDPENNASWDYEVPVYCKEQDIVCVDRFEGGEHFNDEKIHISVYDYEDENAEIQDVELTDDQVKILKFLDKAIGGEEINERAMWTGDPWKDNGVSWSDFI